MLSLQQIALPSICNLPANSIDIWLFSLLIPPKDAEKILNKEELHRANRYHFNRHRRRFITARAVLRHLLSRYVGQEAQSIEFTKNRYGKPSLLPHYPVTFNLSHSGEFALLAVGEHHPLGIDLEFFSPRPYEGIAKQLFSVQELALFSRTPAALKPQLFFEIWAKKEAFIKACGMGLAYPTASITMPMFHALPTVIIDPLENKSWIIRSFMPQIACQGALCHHPSIEKLRFFQLTDIL